MYPHPTSQKSSFLPKYGQIFSGISDPRDLGFTHCREVIVTTSLQWYFVRQEQPLNYRATVVPKSASADVLKYSCLTSVGYAGDFDTTRR